jgi:hypothetical protein
MQEDEMFPNRKRDDLIDWVKEFAENKRCPLSELYKGKYPNKVLLQPLNEVSQSGTDETLVRDLCLLMNCELTKKYRNNFVAIEVKSLPTGERPDYRDSEPNFAASDLVYFIEVNFK